MAPGNQGYKSNDGILYDKSCKKFLSYPAGKRGDFQVPNGVEIGREAFYGCMLLGTVILLDSLNYIGWCAFSRSSLNDIEIPQSVNNIGDCAFRGCSKLKHMTIQGDYYSQDPNLGDFLFDYCSALTEITISNTVSTIQHYAFNHSDSLGSFIFPPSIIQPRQAGRIAPHKAQRMAHGTVINCFLRIILNI